MLSAYILVYSSPPYLTETDPVWNRQILNRHCISSNKENKVERKVKMIDKWWDGVRLMGGKGVSAALV